MTRVSKVSAFSTAEDMPLTLRIIDNGYRIRELNSVKERKKRAEVEVFIKESLVSVDLRDYKALCHSR